MEDIFYLNKNEITLNIFSTFVYHTFNTLYENVKMNIYTNNFQIVFTNGGKMMHCEWTMMKSEEFYEDTSFLQNNQISYIVMITHHTYELHLIIPIIKAILFEFGGMVGNDSDFFHPLFTFDNIVEFHYAWDVKE